MHGAVPVQARGLESLKHCRLLRNCELAKRATLRRQDCVQRTKACAHAEELRTEKSRNGRGVACLLEPFVHENHGYPPCIGGRRRLPALPRLFCDKWLMSAGLA